MFHQYMAVTSRPHIGADLRLIRFRFREAFHCSDLDTGTLHIDNLDGCSAVNKLSIGHHVDPSSTYLGRPGWPQGRG